MGKRTYALYKDKIYTWIDLLRKFKIKHQKNASAHVEWVAAYAISNKLPEVFVVDKEGNILESDIEFHRKKIEPKNENITKRHREFVWKRDVGNSKSGNCYVCNCIITDDNFETSHVKSKFNGGTNHVSNLRATCLPCNRAMGTTDLEEFKKDFIINDLKNFNEYLKNIDVTKDEVIEFFTLHKPGDGNVRFYNKAIELLSKC